MSEQDTGLYGRLVDRVRDCQGAEIRWQDDVPERVEVLVLVGRLRRRGSGQHDNRALGRSLGNDSGYACLVKLNTDLDPAAGIMALVFPNVLVVDDVAVSITGRTQRISQ